MAPTSCCSRASSPRSRSTSWIASASWRRFSPCFFCAASSGRLAAAISRFVFSSSVSSAPGLGGGPGFGLGAAGFSQVLSLVAEFR